MCLFCKVNNLIRGGIRYALGILIFNLRPDIRDRLLQYWCRTQDLKGFSKLLFNGIYSRLSREYYLASTLSKQREKLKRMCMGKEGGIKWGAYYADKPFPNKETQNIIMWKWLEDSLNSGEIKKVHQIACSSGREIAYLSRKYPAIEFTGSDLDDEVVRACRKRWDGIANLRFEALDLSLLGEREIKKLSVDIIFDSGGLQYLDEKTLKDFLRKACMASRHLLLSEPLAIDFLMDKHCHSAPRGGFSWSHPYMTYMKEEGWLDAEYKAYFIEEYYWAKTVSIKARGQRAL